jgi:type IV pilus assembly protein PilB
MLNNVDKATLVTQTYSELNRKFEEQETQRQAQQQNIPYINLHSFPLDLQALRVLPEPTAVASNSAVFYKEGHTVKVGTRDVQAVTQVVSQLKSQGFTVEAYLVSQSSFKQLLDGYSKVVKVEHSSGNIDLVGTDSRFELKSLADLGAKFSNISATEMIDVLLGSALGVNSSDIHVEPEESVIKIRFRIDGVLQDVASFNHEVYKLLISRIKIISKLKLNVVAVPQDGSFGLTYDQQPVDIRVSILPSAYGESVVMRLLRQDKGGLKFDDLGISGLAREQILREIQKPNGMVLTTGPTGSGKTTTLYAILNQLNEPGVKIITLEDPVEYKISGITQTPIDSNAGMTFASGLRAILRQDPDIILVGEMRDLETAETAAQAALTGHIVLSTLHTNDAPAAIPRLLDMGIRSFVLAPAINAVIGQRLVRKICSKCKVAYELPENLRARVELILQGISKESKIEIPQKLEFFHSPGCPECKGLGYKGRIGVYEVFTISDKIEEMISKGDTTTEIRKQAIAEGMVTMAQDGVLKALAGLTDVEEVFRVTE